MRFHDLLGNADEHAVCPGLLLVTLPRRHALDLVHPPPRRACAVAKPLDSSQVQRFGQTADQAGDDAHHIPQQRVVGRMMNVGLHHRGVDPQLRAVLQSELDRRLNHQVVDRFQRLRRQPDEAALERIVLRHRRAVEVGELAQRQSIGDPLAQLAIVPVLDAA